MKANLLLSTLLLAASLAPLAAAPAVDGAIAAGEYPSSQALKDGTFTLHWRFEGDTVAVAIEAASRGWVAIGLDPAAVMSKSDMVFGMVGPDGATQAIDAWCTGNFGPHPADLDQGGKSDILASAGKRTGDRVVFEFSRRQETGDALDKAILPGKQLKVIWATGRDLDLKSKHDKRGSALVSFGSAR